LSLYTKALTIPPNTGKDNPKEAKITLEGDILTEITIIIPPGHAGLTGLAIFYGIEQLAPLPSGEWFIGDNERISWVERWEIPEGEAEIIIRGYNEDDTYPHSFICRFEVEPEEVVKVQQQILEEIKALREEIRALREEMVAPAIGAPIILEEILGIGS